MPVTRADVLDLDLFEESRRCPKCGSQDVSTIYHEDAHEAGCVFSKAIFTADECCSFEHLERLCRRCGFGWGEQTLRGESSD